MRIAVLNNLRAGQSTTQVARLLRFLRSHPDVIHVETDSAAACPEALSDLARQGVDVLAVNGGDGTLAHVLTDILEDRVFDDRVPLVAPLRGGSTNMTALDLRARRDPVKAMARLVEAARRGRIEDLLVERAVLRVEHGTATRRDVLCGMFFGAGLIHRAIELSHRIFPHGRSQGSFGATLLTGTLIGKQILRGTDGMLTPDKLQILFDGEPLADSEFTLVIGSTLGRLFAGMRPFLGEEPAPVRFTAIAGRAKRQARSAPAILRGRRRPWIVPAAGYHSRNAKRVVLSMDCGFTVDGELFAPEPGRIVSLSAHERVRFLRV